MASPMVKYPDTELILPPQFMGSVGYYAAMSRYGRVVVDTDIRYDKRRKEVHRCDIVDTRGPVQLTVPVGKPSTASREARPTWCDCAVSTHDAWWHRMRITLESAYGRTPYFEFLIDKFDDIFRSPALWDSWPNILTMDQLADSIIRRILAFENEVIWAPVTLRDESPATVDMRRHSFALGEQPHYWQIRADQLGFHPNLSILDLIFNLGPEAALHIRRR